MASGVLDGNTQVCADLQRSCQAWMLRLHPDGRHTVVPTGLMRITAEHSQLYGEHKAALRRVLRLSAEVSEY